MSLLLSSEQIIDALAGLPGWRLDETRPALCKSYKFSDFVQAFSFMTACAEKAEAMNHHPEWFNVYSRVEVTLTTHDAGGVTHKDLELAGSMEEIAKRVLQ